jgi:two-component system LytT family sensor kinase
VVAATTDFVNADNGPEWRTWVVVSALAMLFGLMEAAQLRLGSSVLGQGMPIGVALARVLPYWALAAGVMIAIAAIGRRFRIWQFLLRPNLAAVAATATGLAALALAGRALLATADPRTGAMLRPTPLQLFQTYFPLDLLTYTAFVGTLYAFHYYREARRREITASQLQASLAEARLGGLEARIDPDFLFNTLSDISALAGQGLQKPVIDRLGRLSEVLRAALSDQRPEEIPLRQELTLLDGYLSITDSGTLRRHQFLVDAAPGVLTALVPRMMLPTIAEHILRRGKDEHGEAGTVTVRAKRLDETVRLDMTVAREPSSNGEWQDYESGLDSLREQLHRLHGRSQTFELVTRGTGVVATIDIPFREGLAGEGGPTA